MWNRGDVEVDYGIWRREAPVGVLAPFEVERALGCSKGNARKGISIAHESLTRIQARFEVLYCLPPVRREEKVHGGIICPKRIMIMQCTM